MSTTITFHIGSGSDCEDFTIDKELVCSSSTAFSKAFNSQFIEGATQTMKISDITPEVFDIFARWILLPRDSQTLQLENCIPYLFRLWVFADCYLISHLCFQATIQLSRLLEKSPVVMARHITWVHDNTVQDSPLRLLVVRHFVFSSWVLGAELETEVEMWKRAERKPEMLMDAHDGNGWYGNKTEHERSGITAR